MKINRLTEKTLAADIREFYWLKKEFQEFCRKYKLSSSGGKHELLERIQHFLKTGEKLIPVPVKSKSLLNTFSLDLKVPLEFQCNRAAREFFIFHAGTKFRYTVELQNYIKTRPGITFGDVIQQWRIQEEKRKSGLTRTKIGAQFEYNQFTRSFFDDPENANKTRQDCIDAWKKIRATRGDRKYRRVRSV